ncbi:hypothetical protein P7K49_020775 [Saguinus oedipus]|uniref:Telomere-length maintenance and DNA damage repair domain-containing protein n=1 Tax=Saguinus oedipus TaxID=9490 RepID=A0ABQ9UT19_SAGOE|nr:hypothetical protein P7K49_020775 [Saguinus oedipus]
MSLALNDLLICCRHLEHDRATERKKEVEKFKRLIRDPETIKHLDRHSDSKQGKYLNWDAVFRQEKSSSGLNHILAALIIFLKTLAANSRIQVCELGDEILPTLLYIWTQHRLNDSLKEVIIELFELQIYIHHPKGAKTQEKGAYESTKWKSILYNLYDLLVNEISHIGSRGKYSSGFRNIAVKENLIELMADICHQEVGHIPETVKTGIEPNICEVNKSFSLKESIMRWLLFYQLEDDLENSTEVPPILHSNFPHLVLEKILVSLTMKNCKAAMNFFQSVAEWPASCRDSSATRSHLSGCLHSHLRRDLAEEEVEVSLASAFA